MRRAVVQFEMDHLRQIDNRDGRSREELEEVVKLIQDRPGLFYSLTADERLIGVAGVVALVPGVGYPMAVFTDELAEHKLWVHRTVKRYLKASVAALGLKKLGAVSVARSARDCRWLESLGFKLGGPLPDYLDSLGRSYFLYLNEVTEWQS